MKRLLILLILLVPGIAFGGGWETCEDMTGAAKGWIAPFEPTCFDSVSGDLDSALLHVGVCDNIDVVYNADTSSTDAPAISIQVMSCVFPTVSANNCLAMDNATLLGTDASFEILGGAAEWIFIDGSGTIDDDTPRVLVRCNK